MQMLTDGLLLAGSLFAGIYCWVLSRRVNDLKSLDKGLGASIVTLTRQIELARGTLEESRAAAGETRQDLSKLIGRSELAARQLRLVLAAARETEQSLATLTARPAPVAVAAPAPPVPIVAAPEPAAPPEPAVAVEASPTAPPDEPPSAPREAAIERPPTLAILKPRSAVVTELPKPRSLPPLEEPLPARTQGAPLSGEDALLEALTALASGNRS